MQGRKDPRTVLKDAKPAAPPKKVELKEQKGNAPAKVDQEVEIAKNEESVHKSDQKPADRVSADGHTLSPKSHSQEKSDLEPKQDSQGQASPTKNAQFIESQFNRIFDKFANDEPLASVKVSKSPPQTRKAPCLTSYPSKTFKTEKPLKSGPVTSENSTVFSTQKKSPRSITNSELFNTPKMDYSSIRKSIKSARVGEKSFPCANSVKKGPETNLKVPTSGYFFKKKSPQKVIGVIEKQLKADDNIRFLPKTAKSSLNQAYAKTASSILTVKSPLTKSHLQTIQNISHGSILKMKNQPENPEARKTGNVSRQTLSQTLKSLDLHRLPSPPKPKPKSQKQQFPKPSPPPPLTFPDNKQRSSKPLQPSFFQRAREERKHAQFKFTSTELKRELPKKADDVFKSFDGGNSNLLEDLKSAQEGKKSQEASIMSKLLETHSEKQRKHCLKVSLNNRFHDSMTKTCSFLSAKASMKHS